MRLHYFFVPLALCLALSTAQLVAVEVSCKPKLSKRDAEKYQLSKEVAQNIRSFKRERDNLTTGFSQTADNGLTLGHGFHRDKGQVLQFKGLNVSAGLPGTIGDITVPFNINQGRGKQPLHGTWVIFLMEPDGKTHQLASGEFNEAPFAQGTVTFPMINDPIFGVYKLGVHVNNTLNNTLLSVVFCPEPPPSTVMGQEIIMTTTKNNYWIQNSDGGLVTLSVPHSRGFCILPQKSMTLTTSYVYGDFAL